MSHESHGLAAVGCQFTADSNTWAVSLPFVASHREGVLVAVWVIPGASRDSVGGVHDGALRVRTTAPPEAGRANTAVAHLVARHFGVRSGAVVSGHASRRKQVLVTGVTLEEAEQRLGAGG